MKEEIFYIIYYIRKRILKFILFFIFLIMIYFYLSDYVISIANSLKPEGVRIIARSLLEYLALKLKISLILSILTILPIFSVLAFRKLGLKIRLKHLPWILISIILFISGAAFTYYLLLPAAINILTKITLEANVQAYYTISSFVSFVFITMIIFALTFELPLVVFYLVSNGYISIESLTSRRRYVYVAIVIFAAIITADPTPVSQILLSIPLILLYEISIIISKVYLKMKRKREKELLNSG